MALTSRDRKLATNSLIKMADEYELDEESATMKLEWQRILMLGIKCEIQWLDESGNINNWLERQMGEQLSQGQ